jgi:hypothetical protein
MLNFTPGMNRYTCGVIVRDLINRARRWMFYKGLTAKDLVVSSVCLLMLFAVIVIFSFSFFAVEELVK